MIEKYLQESLQRFFLRFLWEVLQKFFVKFIIQLREAFTQGCLQKIVKEVFWK